MGENNSGVNYLGLAVLILGLGLLLLTFFTAYSFISNPESLTKFAALAPEVSGEMGSIISPVLEIVSYLVAAILLWVMGSISGRVMKHGLEMFESGKENKEDSPEDKSTDGEGEEPEKKDPEENIEE